MAAMDTTLLRSFLTLSQLESFSAAAARLHVTQSTISHQIARLEAQLGKPLFERTTRRCRLTAEGRALVPHAIGVLGAVEAMEAAFRPEGLTGRVTFGVPEDYYLFDTITEALRGFLRDRPGVAVEMRAGLAVNHLRELKAGHLDLALLRDGTEGEALRRDPMVWITAAGWVMPADGVVPLAAIDGGCAYRRAAVAALDAAGMRWRCRFSCTSLEGVLSVVRAGLAISAVIAGDARQGLHAIPAAAAAEEAGLPRLPDTTLRLCHSGRAPSLAARALARTMAGALILR